MRLHLPDGILKRADADLSDLTTAKRSGEPYWDPDAADMLVVPMEGSPSAAQKAEIRRRMVTEDAADEQRLHKLIEARSLTGEPGDAAKAKVEALFRELWLDTELAKYGETWVPPVKTTPATPVAPATPAVSEKKK